MPSAQTHATKPTDALDHIRGILGRQSVERELAGRSAGPRHELQHELLLRQQKGALWREVNQLHPADIAFVLENLPLTERRAVWEEVEPRHNGAVLLEVSDAVRANLLDWMDRQEVLDVTTHLDSDEIADLVPDLPQDVVPSLMERLAPADRQVVQSALSFPEGSVGSLMEFDATAIRADVALDVVLRWLRRRGSLPTGVATLPVVDRDGVLQGVLRLDRLLTRPGDTLVADSMDRDPVAFHIGDRAADAAHAFERYDLIAAPVTNIHGTLVGLLKVEAVLDHVKAASQRDLLSQVGLREEEDLFAPVWKSARNRGLWLALNLVTAFIASRVIGHFEGVIEQIVALAALMPIVAAVGGNTGNQTLALVIRGYALGQIAPSAFRRLLLKESAVGFVNGTVWGGTMAVATLLLYGDPGMALVMFAAMLLTLTFASLAGAFTPALLRRLGQDPAYGSAILVTGFTDSLGFFIFLGLAAAFLVR
ncbi:MAG: magnesium transporter [Chromatiaceae bacterium]|nr:magnesium transporter [Chromatiaceae bacterium]